MSGLLNPKEWSTEGSKTNPAAQTVLAQYQNENPTGETHRLHWAVSSSIGGTVVEEHIEDDGTTVLKAHTWPVTASMPFETMSKFVTLDAGQRIRVRTGNAILLGVVQCSLYVE